MKKITFSIPRLLVKEKEREGDHYLDAWTWENINNFSVEGFMSIKKNEEEDSLTSEGLDSDDEKAKDLIVIQINHSIIKQQLFTYVLQFLYTGTCDVQKAEAEELSSVAERLWLDELSSFCKNINNIEDSEECKAFNSSLSTYWIDSVGVVIKKWYLEEHYKSDLQIATTFDEHSTVAAVVVKEEAEPGKKEEQKDEKKEEETKEGKKDDNEKKKNG